MSCEETGRRVGSLAGSLMDHRDPKVRSVAGSALTQVPNHVPPTTGLSKLGLLPNVCPTCGQSMAHGHKPPSLAELAGSLPPAPAGLSSPGLLPYKPGTVVGALAEVLLKATDAAYRTTLKSL